MTIFQQSSSFYQVGGSLPPTALAYVERTADEELLDALLNGEFCYVFNARQMGKSSLRVRTMERLQLAGVCSQAVDLTAIGTQSVDVEQWYAAIAVYLAKGFKLSVNVGQWWRSQAHLPVVSRLGEFIETVLLAEVEQPIVIFVDEIDAILSLRFSTDDFFALIRTCFNRRADNPAYRCLTFALFGVTTPSELITDKTRTPFNIGRAIALRGFQESEAAPLLPGLAPYYTEADAVLRRILAWTGGQPFLTQKLCLLAVEHNFDSSLALTDAPPLDQPCLIDQLVQRRILRNWESQDEPEHLKTIRDRLLVNEQRASRLLGFYQRILLRSPLSNQNEPSEIDLLASIEGDEQTELILSGLIEKHGSGLRVKNPIYQSVFDLDWVAQQLSHLRPHAQMLNAWVASGCQDSSRLLRGKALQDVLHWSQDKSLSDLDYRFLAASQDCDRKEVQRQLEAERLAELEMRLAIEHQQGIEQRKSLRQQRILLSIVTLAMAIATVLGLVAYVQSQRSAVSEVKAIVAASEGSFGSNQHLDALLQAIQSRQKFQRLGWQLNAGTQAALGLQTHRVLEQAIYGADEFNRLSGHTGGTFSATFSPDGQWIATAGTDRTMRLWRRDGILIRTVAYATSLYNLRFSADSQRIAAAGLDGNVKVWGIDGADLATLKGHTAAVWGVAFSPDGQTIASASGDRTVKLWQANGTLIRTLTAHAAAAWSVAFSPDGKTLASTSVDGTIKLWQTDGTLLRTLQEGGAAVWSVAFSPDGQTLVTGSADNRIRLWSRDGTFLKALEGHTAEVLGVAFSSAPQSLDNAAPEPLIASASADKTIKLWRLDGTLLKTFQGHRSVVRAVAFSPDAQTLISASEDGGIKLWNVNPPLLRSLYGHQDVVWRVVYAPKRSDANQAANQALLATISRQEVKLWQANGTLLKTISVSLRDQFYSACFTPDGKTLAVAGASGNIYFVDLATNQTQVLQAHTAAIYGLAFSPNGQFLISVGDDLNLKLWQRGEVGLFQLRQTIPAHSARIWDLAISRDGQLVASASIDGTVKLWGWASPTRLAEAPAMVLKGHTSAVWGVAISPNGEYVASSGRDGNLLLWTRRGKLIRKIAGNSLGLTRVAFSPDNRFIAVGLLDNAVKLWSLDGTLVGTLTGHTSGVLSVAFSPDGHTLASGGYDQAVILWNLQKTLNLDLLGFGCSWVRDYLQTNADVEDHTLCKK